MGDSNYKMPAAGPKVAPKLSDKDMVGPEVSNRGYPGGRNLKDLIGAESISGPSFMGIEGGPSAEVSNTHNQGKQPAKGKIPA